MSDIIRFLVVMVILAITSVYLVRVECTVSEQAKKLDWLMSNHGMMVRDESKPVTMIQIAGEPTIEKMEMTWRSYQELFEKENGDESKDQ